MNVIRAEILGFCGGVRRAIAMLETAADRQGPVYTLHAVVHNEHVMAQLRQRGVILVHSISDIPDGATVALTAHGAPLPTLAALNARELPLIDATCPIVRDAQRTVAENAHAHRFTVIYGDQRHQEVLGLLSHAVGWSTAAESVEGVEIPADEKLAIVAQTTKSPESLRAFAKAFASTLKNSSRMLVQDTTCAEPVARYRAARELSDRVDAMVVVGSSTSANTKNLYETCRSGGRPALFVESADAIDPSQLAAYHIVGLTAGASTPDEVIDAVEARLQQI